METMEWQRNDADERCLVAVNKWLASHAGKICIKDFFAQPRLCEQERAPMFDIAACKMGYVSEKSDSCYRITLAQKGADVLCAQNNGPYPAMVITQPVGEARCEVRLWEIPLFEVG